jgi:hypothetical protein
MFDRMPPDQRKDAIAEFRRLQRELESGGDPAAAAAPRPRRLRLR